MTKASPQEMRRNYAEPLNVNGEGVQLKSLRPRHHAILDYLLASPSTPYGEVAKIFGVTPAWLSTVINSDLFQAALRKRRAMMDDQLTRALTEEIQETAMAGVRNMRNTIEDAETSPDLKHRMARTALEAMGLIGKAGPGTGSPAVQNTIVLPAAGNAIAEARARKAADDARLVSGHETRPSLPDNT